MSIATSSVSTSAANIYASAGSTAITWLTLTNTADSGNVTANVFVVPAGSTANTENTVLANLVLTAGDSYQLYQAGEKLLLDTGDSIQANSSNTLSAVVSYTTI